MKISYHAWKDYQECPRKFQLRYIKRQSPAVPRNDYFTLYGLLTEKFFQMFSNIWRFKIPYMNKDDIQRRLKILYDGVIETTQVNWSAPYVKYSSNDIFNQSLEDINTIMNSDSQNYFLNTKSEVLIEIEVSDGVKITGRLDFIHSDPISNSSITIFDGKGTDKLGKNVSNDQILYYCLLYYFHNKILPVNLGFFYYRFNTFVPVPIDMAILNEFRARVSLTVKQLLADTEFKACPSAKSCKYCDYKLNCHEGLEDSAKRKRPSKLIQDDLALMELI